MYRLALTLLAACGPGPLPVAEVDRDCTPQYQPTYQDVYQNTFRSDCGVGGCHAGAAPRAGLDLSDEATARAQLLEEGLVIPGDPEHSEMIMRVFTTIDEYVMPRGEPLSEAEQCALALWVLDGAEP
jgi:hypothetical protein